MGTTPPLDLLSTLTHANSLAPWVRTCPLDRRPAESKGNPLDSADRPAGED